LSLRETHGARQKPSGGKRTNPRAKTFQRITACHIRFDIFHFLLPVDGLAN
jgi:hypothetical protein